MEIEFKRVLGAPGYRVGSDGSVWTCWRLKGLGYGRGTTRVMSEMHWKPLVGGKDKDGYAKVILCVDGERIYVRVNRLILTAFVGPPPEPNMEAAHENGDKCDNTVGNLRWAKHVDNIADKKRHGTHQAGEKHGGSILTEEQVVAIRRRRSEGASLADVSAEFSVSKATVSAITTGRLWKHVA